MYGYIKIIIFTYLKKLSSINLLLRLCIIYAHTYMERNVYIEGTPDVMDTPIHEAIRMGDTRELQCLLKQGNYSVDGEGSLLWTPLQEAVNVADIDMVKLLLKYGGLLLSSRMHHSLERVYCYSGL